MCSLHLLLPFTMTIRVQFMSLVMMSSPNKPSTSRLIVILLDIIFLRVLSHCFRTLLKISLQTSLWGHSLWLTFMLYLTNSSWSLTPGLRGAVSVQAHRARPTIVYLPTTYMSCTIHMHNQPSFLYCTHMLAYIKTISYTILCIEYKRIIF